MPGFDSVVDTTEFGRDLKPRINAVALRDVAPPDPTRLSHLVSPWSVGQIASLREPGNIVIFLRAVVARAALQ
jgi:hypothetical protein